MQKTQIKNPAVSIAALLIISAFSFFLRWLQNLGAFEADTGYIIATSATTYVFLIYCVLALAAIVLFVYKAFKKQDLPKTPNLAFADKTKASGIIMTLAAAVTAIAGVSIMISAFQETDASNQVLQRILGALCFPLAIGYLAYPRIEKASKKVDYLAILPILFSFVWLIVGYKENAYDPTLWGYAVKILAICSSAAAFLYLGGYFYGRPNPRLTLMFMLIASFFNITTLADAHSTAYAAVFLCAAIVFLTMSYLLIKNHEAPAQEQPQE